VAAPLLTADARELRRLARPVWQRRLLAWVPAILLFVLVGLHTASTPIVCTEQQPCRPDPLSSVYLGALALAALAAFIYPRLAAPLAGAFVVGLVLSERLLRAQFVSPAWLYLVDLGYVGVCFVVGRVSGDRPPSDRSLHWLVGVRRERPPAPSRLPRPGRIWRGVGWVLLGPAVFCLLWGWYAQQRVDAQQAAATRITAEVTAHPDEFTVEVRLPGGSARIAVLDAASYPVGRRIDVLVDDRGLRQPVSEPYDATNWYFLGVVLAGLGWLFRRRGRERAHGPRRLFDEAQPVTEVSVLAGRGVMAVYAGDARPGESALLEIRGDTSAVEPGWQPAYLYGTPAPGHWCTVAVHGTPVVPWRPVSAAAVLAPPYGYGDSIESFDSLESFEAAPVREEDVSVLRPADREAGPEEVRFHVRSAAIGYLSAAALPLTLVLPGRWLGHVAYGTALLLAGAVLALSCAIAWRLQLRGRIAWNGYGLAVVGALGFRRVDWSMVTRIDHDDDSVTVHTGDTGLVVGAGPVLGIFGRRDRGAEELAIALRLAKSRAPASVDGDLVPSLDPPRPPIGLYLVWLLGTPLYAGLLQIVAS
jgi:hypothetical protein